MADRPTPYHPETPLVTFNKVEFSSPPPVVSVLGKARGIAAMRCAGISSDPSVRVQEWVVPPITEHVLISLTPNPPGMRELRLDGQQMSTMAPADSVYIMAPNTDRRGLNTQELGDVIAIHLDRRYLDDPTTGVAGWDRPSRRIDGGGPFRDLFKLLISDAASGRLTELALESYAALFALRLPERDPIQIQRGGLAGWQIKRTTEYLVAHLAEEVSLSDLAAMVGLSTFHFARSFRQSTGVPPHRYQLRMRVERAKTLLRTTEYPVSDIAARVGYDTPQVLTRLFRKEVGMTPTAYRRHLRQ